MAFPKKLTVYAAAGAISLVAWVLNVAQLYWMAGALLLLPHASRLFGLWEHQGILVRRTLPRAGHQGEAVTVHFHVTNQWSIPKLHLSLADALPNGLVASEAEPVPVHLPPKGSDDAEYTLQLRRRGAHTLSTVRVSSTDLLGLFPLASSHAAESHILVYPRVIDLPGTVLPPDLGGGMTPLETSQRKGEGSSFFGIREYRPGDPLRHVHWRSAARLGRLAVIEWEAEQSTDALLALETRRGSDLDLGSGSTLDLASGIAASLARAILAAGDSLRVMAPGTTEWRPSADRGLDAMPGILENLARVQAVSEISLAAELRQAAPQLAPGTLVCVLTSQGDAELCGLARFLRAARLRPVVYALDATEPGKATSWTDVQAELESMQVPVIRIRRDHEVAVRLLG